MELVRYAIAVSYFDGFKSCIVNIIQTANLSHLCTKTTIAKVTIASVYRTVVGNIIAGNAVTTAIAMDFCHDYYLDQKYNSTVIL